MITLTAAHPINSVLGGNTPIGYNHFVIAPFTFDPVARTITAQLRLTSIASPESDVVRGSMTVELGPTVLVIRIDQLNFQRRVVLSGGQVTAVQAILTNAQNALESGLVSLGVIAGVQSPGA